MSSRIEKLHLEKVGAVGSVVATLCCLGFGPLLAFLSAIGAGFLINDRILAPLLLLALIAGGIGLFYSGKRHGSKIPLRIHIVAGITIVFFTFVKYIQPLVWVGIVFMLAAPACDIYMKRKMSSCEEVCEPGIKKEKNDG